MLHEVLHWESACEGQKGRAVDLATITCSSGGFICRTTYTFLNYCKGGLS